MALCNITGTVYLPNGELARSRAILFRRNARSIGAEYLGVVLPDDVVTQTNAAGAIDVDLLTGAYTVLADQYGARANVPDAATADFADIVAAVVAPDVAPAWFEQALQARDEAAASADDAASSAADAEALVDGAIAAAVDAVQGFADDAAADADAAQVSSDAAASSALAASAARDAAFANASVYADIATGRTAVTDGQQFMVATANDVIRYRRDTATTQTELARYPTVSGVDLKTFTRINMGSVQPIGTVAATNIRTWFRRVPANASRTTYATSIEIDAPAGPIKVASAFVGADLVPVYHDIRTVQHSGGRAITTLVPPVEIPAGAHVGFRVTQNGTRLTTTVEDFWYSSVDPDALGQTALLANNESGSRYWSIINVDAGPVATALAAGQDSAVDSVAKASVIQNIGYGKLFDLASLPGQTSSAASNLTIYTGPEFRAAFDATISGIRVWANTATVATITVYDVTETETTIAFSPVLSIRVSLDAGKNTVSPDLFRGVTVRQGQAIGIAGAQLRYGFGGAGKLVPKISVESQQGAGFFVTKPVPQESWNIAFEVTLEALAGEKRAPQREIALAAGPVSLGDAGYIQTSGTGLNVWAQSGTSDIAVRRSTASVTIPLADAGQARYSLVCYNRFTNGWSVVAGPSRLRDAQAFRPAPTAGTDAMFLIRSGDASITEVFPVHRLGHDGISSTLRSPIDQALQRNRAMCPKLMRKIRARQPIRILSIGDSITQISQSAASATAPNGDRDRLKYLTENNVNQYGADFIATVPRFTSAQIGRPGDSFTDHVKIGFIWELIAGLEAMGYALGVDLFYDNFCRSGSATIDFVSDANVFSAWGQAALALTPYDLVITAWGMNELAEGGTGGRLILIANAFRALGSEMLMTDSSARKATWSQARINRDQTQRAAWAAGTAHASWQWVDGPQWGEGLAVAALDRVAANGTNHPGVEELGAFGKSVRYSMLGV